MWTLILRFQIANSNLSGETKMPPKEALMGWTKQYLQQYPDLQLQPDECLAIEDTLAGIQAAKRAGISVVGVANTYPFHFMQRLSNWAIDYLIDLELERIETVFNRSSV